MADHSTAALKAFISPYNILLKKQYNNLTGHGRAMWLPALDALASPAPAGRAPHPGLPLNFEFEFECELPAALPRGRKHWRRLRMVLSRILIASERCRQVFISPYESRY